MKNIVTTLLILLSVVGFSQTKVRLEVENNNEKEQYKLILEREVDGKTVITEKKYNSKEEMQNDPALQDLNLNIMQGEEFSLTEKDGGKHIIIKLVEEEDGNEHKMLFFSDDEDGEKINIEVTVDEDENHHVAVNGKEVDYEEWKNNNELHMSSGKMEWVEEGKDGKKITKEIIIIKGEDRDKKNVTVEVIMHKMRLYVEEVNAEDEKAFSIEDNKNLKLDEFNFYPNPSNGTFNLKFAGKEKSTMVRVTDINGKEVYAEDIQNFSGSYDKEINLEGLKKGIYLLQVVQGSKAVNKKIVIE